MVKPSQSQGEVVSWDNEPNTQPHKKYMHKIHIKKSIYLKLVKYMPFNWIPSLNCSWPPSFNLFPFYIRAG